MPNMNENLENGPYPIISNPENEKNEFIHSDKTEEVNPNVRNEEDKERDTKEEDFDSFNLDQVEELEKTKKKDADKDNQ